MTRRGHLALVALWPLALGGCYNGPNLRDCSQWQTESIPGCYDGQGGGRD